jgi:serine protease Do
MKKLSVYLAMVLITSWAVAQDLSEIYAKVNPSVVVIKTVESVMTEQGGMMQQTTAQGLGSGVLIDVEGLVLTAAHVVANADKMWVEFLDGETIEARVVDVSRMADVALLRLMQKPKDPVVAILGDSDRMKVGHQIFVIGAPLGLQHSFSSGHISGRHSQNRVTSDMLSAEFFQTDAAINQGNSGGPMFNMDGEVIGIASFILTQSGGFEGLGFAATSNMAKHELMDENNLWVGVDPFILSGELAQIFNLPQEAGMLVMHVPKNTPAYFMGLKGGYVKMTIGELEIMAGGDIILGVDGIPLDSQENLEKIIDHLNALPSQAKYRIKILRGGKTEELEWVKD